jgi:hypothetical protein
MLEGVCGVEFPYPKERFAGRGIVICGGGEKYLPSVYVLVRLLRHLRCRLPVEVWHLGKEEMPDAMRGLLEGLGSVCVDAEAVRRVHPVRRLGGWELKCYALMYSAFAEVLLLDADNCPVRNPDFLFTTPQYREHGAIFWPDYTRFAKGQAVWVASGIPYRDEPEFESGQIVMDKARCWRALNTAIHLNEHSDWWYRVVHGDKDTFHLAWRKIGQSYAMPDKGVEPLEATMLQHDFSGKLLFQHRNFAKWTLEENRRIPGFRLEEKCLRFVAELRARWQPGLPLWVRKWEPAKAAQPLHAVAARLCRAPLDYVRAGLGSRLLEFRPDGTIGTGAAGCERWWDLRLVKVPGGTRRSARVGGGEALATGPEAPPEACAERHAPPVVQLEVFGQQGLTFRARPVRGGGWRGAWVAYERTEVNLRPTYKGPKRAKRVEFGRQEGRNGEKSGKGPVFHVPKRDRNVREPVRDVPKRQRNGREPVGDVPKHPRNGREAVGDVPKRQPNVRKAVGDVSKRQRNGRKPVGDAPKRPRNDREAGGDVPKRPRNDRELAAEVADGGFGLRQSSGALPTTLPKRQRTAAVQNLPASRHRPPWQAT